MQDEKGRFLGKETEYKFTYDNTLLVPINRGERRKEFKNYVPMYGGDIWTAFEVSFLNNNGVPQFHVLRFLNPANSTNIYESKSFKLYLNSFNNTKFESLKEVLNVLKKDLKKLTKSTVKIKEYKGFKKETKINGVEFVKLEEVYTPTVDTYTYDPSLLKIQSSKKTKTIGLTSSVLRSNCEITGQPDWASIQIVYTSDGIEVDEESLLKYIISFRNHQEFHEPTCERIFQDLHSLLNPKNLLVICQYTRRGGIDINPIRCSSEKFLKEMLGSEFKISKTIHQ